MSKLDGYKRGDRFSVTMNGTVRSDPDSDGDMRVIYDGAPDADYIFAGSAADPHFQITRIEPALAVGEMVTWGRGVADWEVVAIKGDDVIIYNKLRAEIMPLSDLRRA